MKTFSYILLILSVSYLVQAKENSGVLLQQDLPDPRIILGNEAKVGDIPWMVAIKAKKAIGYDFCGGALISEEWVLTSADCISKGHKYVLQFGGITTNLIEIGRVELTSNTALPHHQFDPLTKNFDVALINLPRKLTLNDRIKTISLPKKGAVVGNLIAVNIAGWGSTKPDGWLSSKLHHVDLSTTSNIECQKYYGKEEIISSSICAQGFLDATPCDGDHGGPLYTTNPAGKSTLVAIFSFYHKLGCDSRKPTVYVRVEPLLSWISSVTGIAV